MRRLTSNVFTALTALLVLSAVASASASAATTPEWFVKGRLLNGTQEVTATSTTPLKFTVPNLDIAIECKSASLTGATIANPGLGHASAISLKECEVTSKPACNVSKTITTGALSSTLAYIGGTEVSDEYTAVGGSSEAIFTLGLTECAFEGRYRINGKLCGNELSPNTETAIKDQVFATRCAMKLGTNPAYLEGTLAFSLAGSQLGSIWTGK